MFHIVYPVNMGKSYGKSNILGLTSEQLQEYVELTYLNHSEIMALLTNFDSICKGQSFQSRVHFQEIENIIPEIKYNPFKDRICSVFSSQRDNCFSFEDLLDFCSAMSKSCPNNVKAAWAFKIYDFDEDGEIGRDDALKIVQRLYPGNENQNFDIIVDNLLQEMDLGFGLINASTFEHVIGKMPEFAASFSFRI